MNIIEILTNYYQYFLRGTQTTIVVSIITVLAGVMSWFSAASGVVMPTLIPTVPGLSQSLTGVSQLGLTVGLCVGAHMAA